MTTPILIDLDNLTREMVEEALPHMGECEYFSPCIIGVLMTPEQRARRFGHISWLVEGGTVAFPSAAQFEEAKHLQNLFDSGTREEFLAHPRIAALMREEVSA